MPKKSRETLCVDDLRHNEYYGMQVVFDELYAKAQKGEQFTDLMSLVLKRENILLAYINIKTNTGSNTPGTDMLRMMKQPSEEQSAEYMDNRISLFSAQWGKCAVTGIEFKTTGEIHCHHKQPRGAGGGDEYTNLTLVLEPVHVLILITNKIV